MVPVGRKIFFFLRKSNGRDFLSLFWKPEAGAPIGGGKTAWGADVTTNKTKMNATTSSLSRVLRPVLATVAFAGLIASARAASRYHDRRKQGGSLRP